VPINNVFYKTIQYLKENHEAMSGMDSIVAAEYKYFERDEDKPYYFIPLPLLGEPLYLSEQQSFVPVDHHLTFFGSLNAEYADFFHYTAHFPNHTLRVFFKQNGDSTGNVVWKLTDSADSLQLTPQQIKEVIQYGVLQAMPTFIKLSRGRDDLIARSWAVYKDKQKQYDDAVFSRVASPELLKTYNADALAAITKLAAIDSGKHYHQYKRLLVSRAAFIDAGFAPTEPEVKNTAPIITQEPETSCRFTLSTKAASVPMIDWATRWADLGNMLEQIKALQQAPNVPNALKLSKVEANYITYLLTLHDAYQRLLAEYLSLADSETSFSKEHQQFCMALNQLELNHNNLMVKGIQTLLLFPDGIEQLPETIHHLRLYTAKLEAKIFRKMIRDDNAALFALFLDQDNFSFQTHLVAGNKTLLEEIIVNKAINCLQEVLLRKTYLNLLDIGDEQLPLASHILKLGDWDPFRMFCIDQISAFQSAPFYQSLIARLQHHPEKETHIQNAEAAANFFHRSAQALTAVSMKLVALVTQHLDVTRCFYDRNEFRLLLKAELEHEVGLKMAKLKTFNKRLYDHLVENSLPDAHKSPSIEHPTQVSLELAVESGMNVLGRILNEGGEALEKVLEFYIKFYHELNEALYYYLPSDAADAMPKSQRVKLYEKHFAAFSTLDFELNAEKIKAKKLEKISEKVSKLQNKLSMARGLDERRHLAEKFTAIQEELQDIQNQPSFYASLFDQNPKIMGIFCSDDARDLNVLDGLDGNGDKRMVAKRSK
jgi:hypothetical protein